MKTTNHTPLRTKHARAVLGAKFAGVPWRPHGDAILRAHHGDLTPKEMAFLLGKPLEAVEGRMRTLKLPCRCPHPYRRWSDVDLELLESMWAGGASAAAIAQDFGRHVDAVRWRIKASGLRRQRHA